MAEPQRETDLDARVLAMRERGAPWKDIAETCSVTRQQARHAYQRAKREERRLARRTAGK